MKPYYFFYVLCLMSLLNSCKSGGSSAKSESCALTGKYINYTILEKCPFTLPGDLPSFAIELEFKSKDTVDIYNGFERFRLPYTGPTDSCTYTLTNATQFGDMRFSLQGDSAVVLFDSAWTQLAKASVFRRIDETLPWDFVDYLNQCVIVGTWTLFKEGIDKNHRVIFLRNGQVDGMKPYLSYDICFAGDCLEETDPHANTMDFTDNRGAHTTFAFIISERRRLIQFYSIGDPVPDMKGARKLGPLAFELRQ